MSAGSPRRRVVLPGARAALLATLLGAARVAAGEEPSATYVPGAPAEPAGPDPTSSADGAPDRPGRDVVVRPHLDVGVVAGAGRLGFSFQGGIRIHPVLLVYSAAVLGAGDEYLTFSGVKVGYQRTLSPWWALYVAAGFGAAGFHPAAGGTRDGSAAVLDAGLVVCPERGLNALAFGVEVLVPRAPAGAVSEAGAAAVVLGVAVNPLLAGGLGTVRVR